MYDGAPCPPNVTEHEKCNMDIFCPGTYWFDQNTTFTIALVDCVVSAWDSWSLCSQSCGGGVKQRVRKVLEKPRYNGTECPSKLTETKYCINKDCPEGKRLYLDLKCVIISSWQKVHSNQKCCGDPVRMTNLQQRTF